MKEQHAIIHGRASLKQQLAYQWRSGIVTRKIIRLVNMLVVNILFQISILAVIIYPSSVASNYIPPNSLSAFSFYFWTLLGVTFALWSFSENSSLFENEFPSSADEKNLVDRRRNSNIRGLLAFSPLALLFLLVVWSNNVYSSISSAFGGGRLPEVQLLIPDNAAESLLSQIGIKVENNVTEPLSLVDISSENFTVLLNNGNAATLPKSLVTMVLYLRSETATPAPSSTNTPTPLVSTPVP